MKVLLLAAGRGDRLRPVTEFVPKPLLRIRGETLLSRHLRAVAAAGFREVVVNTAHLAARIHAHVGDGGRWGLVLRVSHEPDGPLETGGGMKRALPLLGDAPFVAINADILCDFPLDRLEGLAPGRLAHLVLVPNPGWKAGDFALEGSRVPGPSGQGFTFAGIGVYHPRLLEGTDEDRFSIVPLLEAAMARGEVTGQLYRGRWHDTGTLERLAAARRDFRRDQATGPRPPATSRPAR